MTSLLSDYATRALECYLGDEYKSRFDSSVTRPETRTVFEECKRTYSVKSEPLPLVGAIFFGSFVFKFHGLAHDSSSFSNRFEFLCFSFILTLYVVVTEFRA
ncbi:hypothetical protein AALP_AA4G156700 [Arabis alpina]|uniref:Uncharacterized protein n=1 Tax=Arabis alpina TaxID=50452 RepID=A0A087H3J0_ARAAL|nr:hypothetical protein AALP_AA4G156700 [Arabis alpina]